MEAMDTMAEIARHKKMDPEIMLMGATCYFMTGDYERATNWINNTLSYDPQNVGARILLGRLCIRKDDAEQGLKVLNFVAENQKAAMSDKDKEDLEKILEYYIDNMREGMSKYPSLMAYYEAHCSKNEKNEKEVKNAGDGKDKAKAAVDRLKALLKKSKGNSVESSPAQAESKELEAKPIVSEAQNVSVETPDYFIDKVMSSSISLREKVQGLNNFASGLYLNGDYDGALKLLKKALEIDNHDPFVLRNIAYVCVAMKDKEKALEFVKALPMMDFSLIKSIKELGNE